MAIFFIIIIFGFLAIIAFGAIKLMFKLIGFIIDQTLGFIFVKRDQHRLKNMGITEKASK
ncbi:TPA: hypothetical protein ACGYNV_001342 [Listeria monocytogenes]|nr:MULTISPECIES: hypothetical protein [Listeria]EAE3728469.1 hypothetical protein [Listeria monocytogenes serotype 1/2b]EAC5365860.1 hypothetical protein [Listeria monocytogenes]EAC5601095.1 hypothetical protein [Listeria monocytogenes]EAC5777332.1 hypothetical protein [Listeria monocytogenes]EAC7705802.1 hypothetical protein [Listeria monocytogenes]